MDNPLQRLGAAASLTLVFLITVPIVLASTDRLKKGDPCEVNSLPSTCQLLSDCQTGLEAIKAGNPPRICSFQGTVPIVCCPPQGSNPPPSTTSRPPSTTTSFTRRPAPQNQLQRPTQTSHSQGTDHRIPNRPEKQRKAQDKCREYAKYVFEKEDSVLLVVDAEPDVKDTCARIGEPLIVGGVNAVPREFPHMAQIGYGDENPVWLCGGSLISERYVLSAAHCSNPIRRGPAKWARLGDLDTSTDFEDAAPLIVKIVSRYDYPRYNTVTLYNDLTLFKLEHDIALNSYIRPICLSVRKDIPWKHAIATGWGHTYWGGKGSEHLKKVKLRLVSNEVCNNTYGPSIGKQIPQGILPDRMICAGDEEGKDTCQGDSGGPLQVPVDDPYCTYELIGITSFGKSCGNSYPGVYTRISHYIDWIQDIVWSPDYE